MAEPAIIINSNIDARLFREFAMFDTFMVKQRWKSPALFALIMLVSALLCFSLRQKAGQAVLIGIVLLAVGFGLPIIYVVNFLASISTQARKLGLKAPQPFYTITLTDADDGILVAAKGGDKARYEWGRVYGAFFRANCVYLYVQNNRAYLLPNGDVGGQAEALSGLIKKRAVRTVSPGAGGFR